MGWTSLGLGFAGIFLPLLPTTPFLLLAAYAFSRGSERLHRWLLDHPRLGPPIHNWQAHRAISRRVKVIATLSMGGLFAISVGLGVPIWALTLQGSILVVVGVFIWRQRELPDDAAAVTKPQK